MFLWGKTLHVREFYFQVFGEFVDNFRSSAFLFLLVENDCSNLPKDIEQFPVYV